MAFKIELYPHQLKAVSEAKDGCVFRGGVGTGKTYTSLYYYLENHKGKDLYVITTAKKRDSHDWIHEAGSVNITELYIDSWNNIDNYIKVTGAFFIFDEQRAVGSGAWAKSFIKICRNNSWVMCSATPGDSWMDYWAIFVANGFYKNRTEFLNEHVEYDHYVSFPRIKRYHNEAKLSRLRKSILVPMEYDRHTTRHREYNYADYDVDLYSSTIKNRWNPFKEEPIKNASELMSCIRRISNTSPDRIRLVTEEISKHDRVIIFYNYSYELDILTKVCTDLNKPWWEWNGNKHENIPNLDKWVYIVQYTAGSEGWNCTDTNQMIFYSPNYSYKVTEQAEGRIDRINTKYDNLYYSYILSKAPVDSAILKTLSKKKQFNNTTYSKGLYDGQAGKGISEKTDKETLATVSGSNSNKARP